MKHAIGSLVFALMHGVLTFLLVKYMFDAPSWAAQITGLMITNIWLAAEHAKEKNYD